VEAIGWGVGGRPVPCDAAPWCGIECCLTCLPLGCCRLRRGPRVHPQLPHNTCRGQGPSLRAWRGAGGGGAGGGDRLLVCVHVRRVCMCVWCVCACTSCVVCVHVHRVCICVVCGVWCVVCVVWRWRWSWKRHSHPRPCGVPHVFCVATDAACAGLWMEDCMDVCATACLGPRRRTRPLRPVSGCKACW
jgi:hypothetical protein